MGALSSVKYTQFLTKGQNNGVVIADGSGGDPNAMQDFNMLWIQEFKKSHAYEVWERVTDPLLFDIVEARHPCSEKPTVVSDIGLRLSEGIQELKLDQQLAPTREAISRTLAAGSTNFFNAMAGVRERWAQSRQPGTGSIPPSASSSPAPPSGPPKLARVNTSSEGAGAPGLLTPMTPDTPTTRKGLRPLSIVGAQALAQPEPPKPAPSWGSGISSFFSKGRASVSSVASRLEKENDVGERAWGLHPSRAPSYSAGPRRGR